MGFLKKYMVAMSRTNLSYSEQKLSALLPWYRVRASLHSMKREHRCWTREEKIHNCLSQPRFAVIVSLNFTYSFYLGTVFPIEFT